MPLTLRPHSAKEPPSVKEIIEYACRLNPGKTENACKMWYFKAFRPGHAGVLPKPPKAQGANTNRASIGYHEIARWSEAVSQALEVQMELNRKEQGFAHFLKHRDSYMVNADESGFMGNSGGVRVVGPRGSKVEKNTGDNRPSITVLRVGPASGDSGPAFFLLQGPAGGKLEPQTPSAGQLRRGHPPPLGAGAPSHHPHT